VPETGSKLRGAWAKGFRAPTFNDLFFPPGFGCPGFGNLNVEPERSTSWEAGAEQRAWENRVRVRATYFRNKFRDLITGVPIEGAPFCQQAGNIGRARTDGLEFTSEVEPVDGYTIWANYTHLNTENELTGVPLSLHPHHRWNTGVRVTPLPRLTLFAQAHVVSSQFDTTVGRHIPGYYRLDAGGTLRLLDRLGIMERLDFTTRVQNLTDRDYQEPAGYRAQGLAMMFGLKAYFK
jgi:vitamin B12 transporter